MAGVTNVAFRTLCRELERSRVGTVSGCQSASFLKALKKWLAAQQPQHKSPAASAALSERARKDPELTTDH